MKQVNDKNSGKRLKMQNMKKKEKKKKKNKGKKRVKKKDQTIYDFFPRCLHRLYGISSGKHSRLLET